MKRMGSVDQEHHLLWHFLSCCAWCCEIQAMQNLWRVSAVTEAVAPHALCLPKSWRPVLTLQKVRASSASRTALEVLGVTVRLPGLVVLEGTKPVATRLMLSLTTCTAAQGRKVVSCAVSQEVAELKKGCSQPTCFIKAGVIWGASGDALMTPMLHASRPTKAPRHTAAGPLLAYSCSSRPLPVTP
jgi:hypothetical protein